MKNQFQFIQTVKHGYISKGVSMFRVGRPIVELIAVAEKLDIPTIGKNPPQGKVIKDSGLK